MSGATDERPEDRREARDGDGAKADDAAPSTGGDDAIDESLHMALSDLERMLDGREGGSGKAGGEEGRGPRRSEPDDDGEQYTIPLLDEVVIPGPSPVVPPAPAPSSAPPAAPLDDDEPSVRARIAARIASEMDVIIQDRVEQALEHAREEIHDRVRNHLDIILPEIVEELVQARRRKGGGS